MSPNRPIDELRRHYHAFRHALAAPRRMAGRAVSTREDDLWLVSYPKSGNTFTRFLLANLLYPDARIDFETIKRLVPDIYEHTNADLEALPGPRIIKSHEYFDPRYKRVILIVRDPRDVAVSYYHHQITLGHLEENASLTVFVEAFVKGSIDPFGTWGENVGSWLGSRRDSAGFLVLTYEDLVADTPRCLRTLADFVGRSATDAQLRAVAQTCTIDKMRELEKRHAGPAAPGALPTQKTFVRQGRAGGWRTELSAEAAAHIRTAWGRQMQMLGYL